MGSTLGSKAIRFYGRKMEELREGWFEGSHVAGDGKKRAVIALLRSPFESINVGANLHGQL